MRNAPFVISSGAIRWQNYHWKETANATTSDYPILTVPTATRCRWLGEGRAMCTNIENVNWGIGHYSMDTLLTRVTSPPLPPDPPLGCPRCFLAMTRNDADPWPPLPPLTYTFERWGHSLGYYDVS